MSKLNGDKSRYQLRRKAGLRRRLRSREVQAAMQQASTHVRVGSDGDQSADGDQSGGVRGRVVGTLHPVRGGTVADQGAEVGVLITRGTVIP
jgi:hypothetical protein